MRAFFFNHPDYLNTLTWLGSPLHLRTGSTILRPTAPGLQDARGSWPYQALPDSDFLTELSDQGSTLNLTAVIRPDIDEMSMQRDLKNLRQRFDLNLRTLKNHLCHSAAHPPAQKAYSARTRRRLRDARQRFTVQREDFGPSHLIIADWQERVRRRRNVPHISSPDPAHFVSLASLSSSLRRRLACITVRWKQSGGLAAIFLAMQDETTGSWHAHSALSEEAAIAEFSNYLLFDGAINILKGRDLWLGGAPGGTNGAGVFQFKQRFANHSAPAHIVSIDLDPARLGHLRAERGRFDFLPDYRDPKVELALRMEAV